MKKYAYIILLLISFTFSCKKDVTIPSEIDKSYFPLETGNWIEYNVTEITIDSLSNVNDTIKYYLKEIIDSSYSDAEGRIAYKIKKYIKLSGSSQWAIKDIWSANQTNTTAEKVEENIRYVKLMFPVKLNKTWNGNAYNTLDELDYEITELDSALTMNNLTFDSTLTVTQLNVSNMIEKKYFVEKYAKNIGMVYKEQTDIYSDSVDPQVPIEKRITTATIFKMEIINYGTN